MKKGLTILALLIAALTQPQVRAADRTYTLCDPAQSVLCSNLVALYEFDEATGNVRTSETGSAPFIEVPGADVPTKDNTGGTPVPKTGNGALHPDPTTAPTSFLRTNFQTEALRMVPSTV